MIDFGLGLDLPQTTTLAPATTAPAVQVVQPALPIQVVQEVSVSRPSDAVGYAMKPQEQWGWDDLRDYVIREIEQRHGPQLRDTRKESAIFKGFMSRWPEKAVAIAQAAFEVHDGMWRNAPISVNRFCKGSDPFFAALIAERV